MLRCLWKARAWAVLRHGTTVPALMRNVTGFGRGTVLEGINPGVLYPREKATPKRPRLQIGAKMARRPAASADHRRWPQATHHFVRDTITDAPSNGG
jgi:hypothetical protein